jgi:hypothetical protein
MKIPQYIHVISARLEKWATELLPAAAPGSSRYSIHRHLLAGGLIVLLLAGGVGGWAATTQIAGALIAQGSVFPPRWSSSSHSPLTSSCWAAKTAK